jgi:translation initiation factor 2 subunit 2
VIPQVVRDGKKTVFANIEAVCNNMKRSTKHLEDFLFAELGCQGSVDGSKRLIIKGKFVQKQIENVLKKYIGKL